MFSSSGKSGFDKALEKATSSLLLEPDWDATLQICDCIRQKDVTGKYVINALRKKLFDKNARVTLYALQVLESCVKNCGSTIHEEIACKQFMDDMKELSRSSNDGVKNKALEMIQAWAHAFRNESGLKIVVDTFNQLKGEGNTFPPLRESDAMFMAEKAPEWVDGDKCHTCRSEFGVVVRKHHCRHCGQLFCSKCSSKQLPIPKFGIEKAVRVCDPCYSKLTSRTETTSGSGGHDSDLPAEYLNSPLAQQSQAPPQRSERELQEEEELQLAMALSLDAAENKHIIDKDKSASSGHTSSPPPPSSSAPVMDPEADPELARYLNRSYWEQKQEESVKASATPSAPANAPDPTPATAPPLSQSVSTQPMYATSKVQEVAQNGEVPDDIEFLRTLSANLEVFVNRMKSDSSRGRSIASDTSVQTLFHTLTQMHPQLLSLLQEKEDKRAKMESLQDKLAQIHDAREALDALRDDHREKKRREAEEAERQRQIMLAQKLEIMRQKKQEYLQLQQQQALQRLQEHERELQMRHEQQKQQQQMRQIQYTAYAGMPLHQGGMMAAPPQGMMPQQQGIIPPPQGAMIPPGQYSVPQQTFSPPSSMQGSPAHSGYNPQQQTYNAPPPNVDPQATHQPPSNTQPGYTQAYQQPPQQSYQQAPPQGGAYPMGYQQQPPSTQPHPSQGPPSGTYSPLSSLDYPAQPPQQQQQQPPNNNPYNMQGMASSLPPSQQYGGPPTQGGMYQQQPGPPQDMQYGTNKGQQPVTQAQTQPQQDHPQEASLISFD
ncbi:hepatocyte growth factor-regulated tyrosine kinase substrate-like [Acanthaster planci]|uniref:Hepatocyte growth factor-regulated tyrosine kinase substrate n=1 Tax=Acanthaster planci TaxID=133434 RepID=A0A8B7YCC8_ACAPL|nr:hepatocyte growth factor-regulated tyrosine kinase substrate-like [Acanthaster planci]